MTCGAKSCRPFLGPVAQICGKNQIHFFVPSRGQGKLASAASVQAIQWSIHTPTHPSIHPQIPSLPRPAHDAMSFVFGKARAWVLRPGLLDTTSRTQPASRGSGVCLGLNQITSRSPPRKGTGLLAILPRSTFYFAVPVTCPSFFFGPSGEQSPTSTLASSKCHLRAACRALVHVPRYAVTIVLLISLAPHSKAPSCAPVPLPYHCLFDIRQIVSLRLSLSPLTYHTEQSLTFTPLSSSLSTAPGHPTQQIPRKRTRAATRITSSPLRPY